MAKQAGLVLTFFKQNNGLGQVVIPKKQNPHKGKSCRKGITKKN